MRQFFFLPLLILALMLEPKTSIASSSMAEGTGWVLELKFDSINQELERYIPRSQTRDSTGCIRQLESIIVKMRQDGYVAASVDTIIVETNKLIATIHPDHKYKYLRINTGNVPDELITGPVRSQITNRDPISTARINSLLTSIIKSCENNGYPFAGIRLDSILVDESGFIATLRLDKGRLVIIDSVRINGDQVVAPVYLYNHLGIRPGEPYDESEISNISVRLKEIAFCKEARPASVLFTDKYTRLDLFLEKKRASQFDGVIGLLPDDAGGGKPKLTGEVHLRLQNAFKRGESLNFDWRQLPPRSQELNIAVKYPFLFNTPLGVEGLLNLYRRDTLFVDVIKQAGMLVALHGSNYLKLFLKNKQSDLQYTSGLGQLTTLPEYGDVTTNDYGLMGHFERLDYRLNPRRGFWIDLSGSVGRRNIRKNSSINPEVYDSLTLRSAQYSADLITRFYIPLFNRHVFAVMNRSAFIRNPNIFENEMYRIGGLRSLRGFDEESIFATSYSIINLEYRYLTDINSFLFVFANGAWYERKTGDQFITDTPIGFGAGFNVETRLGILSMSYALGKQGGGRFEVRSGKVHFGIINYF
ncbi:MAG: hypothetical protein ACKOQ6_04020 [Bacteroidota bacterium]